MTKSRSVNSSIGSSNDTSSLLEYQNNVISLAEMKSDLVFRNRSSAHGAIVLENIFSNSKKIVRMLSREISSDVSNQLSSYRETVEKFLNNGGVIKVLHFEDLDKDSSIVQLLNEYKTKLPASVLIKKTKNRVFFNNNKEMHFTVGDNVAYRVEVDINNREAIVCFNDKEIANDLIELFDNIFKI